MTIGTTWTDPSDAGTLDLDTDDQLSETVWDAMMSDIKHLGGTAGYIGAQVFHSVDQSLNNITDTVLAFNSERFDSNGFHDTVTNNSRLTVPTGYGGKYIIGGKVRWASNATGERRLQLLVNGTMIVRTSVPTVSGSPTFQHITYLWNLVAGDYVELGGYQASGGALLIEVADAIDFWAVKL